MGNSSRDMEDIYIYKGNSKPENLISKAKNLLGRFNSRLEMSRRKGW